MTPTPLRRPGRTPRFGRLARHFLMRLADYELVAPGGEAHQTAVTGVALLGALNFIIALVLAWREVLVPAAFEQIRRVTILGDASLIVALTMLFTALAAALAWDGFFPNKQDAMTLGSLPLPPSLLLQARIFAVLNYLGAVVLATNAFTALVLPVCGSLHGGFVEIVRSFLGWCVAVTAAAAAVFFAQIAVQGLLLAVLPYAAYQKLSAFLQLGIVLAAFLGFFLMPSATQALETPLNRGLWIVPWWFVGLYSSIRGGAGALPGVYAIVGLAAPLAAGFAALFVYSVQYRRILRNVCEQSEAGPARNAPIRRSVERVFNALLLRAPRTRAVFWFVARTVTRNRRHRMLLAIATAIGIAWAGQTLAQAVGVGWSAFRQPGPALLAVPLELACLLVIGLRALYAMPVDLQANWSFRITERGGILAVRRAAVLFLWTVAILPVAWLPLPVYWLLWGGTRAVFHCLFLTLTGCALLEVLMRNFDKLPFACSILPGKHNLRVTFAIYVVLFTFSCWWVAVMEETMLKSATGMTVGLILPSVVWLTMALRRRRQEQPESIRFDETGQPELELLQLQG
jgi:hypothetical protein